ncbi:hypothetical protein TNCV_2927411 [Trichonephila clavipes]|nr:hypothetical protein TNCV_2927411 [Trichonephila clavipes]
MGRRLSIVVLDANSRYRLKDISTKKHHQISWVVGSLVARASDSRLEGLGSMSDPTKYPPSTHGIRAR